MARTNSKSGRAATVVVPAAAVRPSGTHSEGVPGRIAGVIRIPVGKRVEIGNRSPHDVW